MRTGDSTSFGERGGRRRRIAIVVTAILLVLTAVWCYFDRDIYPGYPAAPASFEAITREHLRTESTLPLNGRSVRAR